MNKEDIGKGKQVRHNVVKGHSTSMCLKMMDRDAIRFEQETLCVASCKCQVAKGSEVRVGAS